MQKVQQGPLHVLVGGSGTGFTEWTHTWTREGTWSTGEDTRKRERNLPLIKGGGGRQHNDVFSWGSSTVGKTNRQTRLVLKHGVIIFVIFRTFLLFFSPPTDGFVREPT